MDEIAGTYRRFLAAHPTRHITIEGHVWPLIEVGDASPADEAIILLPGALGRPETSFEYIAALAATTPRWRIFAPGYPATARSMADLADGVAALLCGRGVTCAHILGGSFGGLVAQALLARHPERVERLILSDTSPPTPARAPRMRASAALIRALPDRTVRGVLTFGVGRYVAAMPPAMRAFWRAHFGEMLATLTKAEVESRARTWAEFDTEYSRLPTAERPTLILCAASDHAVSPVALQRRFPHAAIHMITSPLGHAASVGDATAYIEPIRQFFMTGVPV